MPDGSQIKNSEEDGFEPRIVIPVKRTIDKYVFIKAEWDFLDQRFRHVRMLGSVAYC